MLIEKCIFRIVSAIFPIVAVLKTACVYFLEFSKYFPKTISVFRILQFCAKHKSADKMPAG